MYVSSVGPQGGSNFHTAKALAGSSQHVDDSEGVEDVDGSGDSRSDSGSWGDGLVELEDCDVQFCCALNLSLCSMCCALRLLRSMILV